MLDAALKVVVLVLVLRSKGSFPMTTELNWLVLTCLVTSLFWVPYVLNRLAVRGVYTAMKGAADEGVPHSPWAERARKAHDNAIENLVIFAALILVAHVAGVSNGITQGAAAVYFFTRVAHFFIFVFNIPVARTLTFAVAWASQFAIALTLIGII